MILDTNPSIVAELDPTFSPAVLWMRQYENLCLSRDSALLEIQLMRKDGSGSRYSMRILREDERPEMAQATRFCLERTIKFLLWQRGFDTAFLGSRQDLVDHLNDTFAQNGPRSFDHEFFGNRVFDKPLEFKLLPVEDWPEIHQNNSPVGGHLEGCRIGFDLGGSDRKCAAVIDGKVVFSEEITWDPYHQSSPDYHISGIRDSLKRAAEKLPRVDAIGGSAAGIYLNNVPRVASLFRGIDHESFRKMIQPLFLEMQKEWGVPLEVINDGEVTALAGSMWLKKNKVLGISLGTSLAAGYVDEDGNIGTWLNELAFCPVDFQQHGHADEWSGDAGCGVQYLSQQAVVRLVRKTSLPICEDLSFPEILKEVQAWLSKGNDEARAIFSTIGTYFGYALAHYSAFIDFESLLVLGRVVSGPSGEIILSQARKVLDIEFPDLSEKISFHLPDDTLKRHGQAIAAASLPNLHTQENI